MPDRDRQANRQTGETPLQGWKEIASFLERDPRTAQRWETALGMPVRRHGGSGGSVYAYPSEIEAWRSNSPLKEETTEILGSVVTRPWAWATAATVLVVGSFVLLLSSAGLDPVAEAGVAGGGVRTTEICKCDTQGMLSPDGRYLSETDWVNSGDIGIRDLETGELRRLSEKGTWDAGVGEADRSIFSPDGKQIAYNWLTDDTGELRYELRIIDAFGDNPQPRTIYFGREFRYIEPSGWTRDGRLLVWLQRSDWSAGLGFVSIASGDLVIVKSLQRQASSAMLSRDDRWIAYDIPAVPGEPERDIYLLAANGGSERQVTTHPKDDLVMGFASDGQTLLFASNRTGTYGLWGVSLSDNGGIGKARILMRDIGSVKPMGVAPEGALIYARAVGAIDLYTAELDLTTGRLLVKPRVIQTKYQGSNDGPWLSPDGSRFVYFASPNTLVGTQSFFRPRINTYDLRGKRERRVPIKDLELASYYGIPWSPEGDRILAVARDDQGRWALVTVELETGKTRVLRKGMEFPLRPIGWMPDSRTVLYSFQSTQLAAEGALENAIEAIAPGDSPRRIHTVEGKVLGATLSPQRDRIVWRELGQSVSVKVMPVNGGNARRVLVDQRGGDFTWGINWAPDGDSLLVGRSPRGRRDAIQVWIVPLDGSEPRKTELVVPFLKHLSMHPDGRTVFYQAGQKDIRIFRTENYLPAEETPTE